MGISFFVSKENDMYYAHHTQTGENTNSYTTPYLPMMEAEDLGWEESETEIIETSTIDGRDEDFNAEFPCHYYGDYTCELTANRPDSLCPFHAGEED